MIRRSQPDTEWLWSCNPCARSSLFARLQNPTKAADLLNISRAALSRSFGELERIDSFDLGVLRTNTQWLANSQR